MEKSVTTGMQPEDFSGNCPTCSVECQEDILKLISKFCQGLVVELTGSSLSGLQWQPKETGDWPSFVVSEGGNANSFLEVASKREVKRGDIRFGYSHLYEDDHPSLRGRCPGYGPRGPYPVRFPADSGLNWTKRNTDHIDSLSNPENSADVGVDEIINGVPDFAFNSVTTVIETVDLYSTEDHFAIFPVCGKLRVEDSGTSYIPIKSCVNKVVLDSYGNNVNIGSCETTNDTEALHILVSSDCPDPHIAKTSEHPHLVGRSSEPDTVDTWPDKRENPAYSDKRESDNVEQQMHLGMCRTSYATKVGSVFKTTISGAFDGDHVYYTSRDPTSGGGFNPTDAEISANDLCPYSKYWKGHDDYPTVSGLLGLPKKRYSIDSYDPNWLSYCTSEWTDGESYFKRSRLGELGCWVQCPGFADLKDSRGYHYCGYKLNDLADHTIAQKEYIFASKQGAIDFLSTQVSRQKLTRISSKQTGNHSVAMTGYLSMAMKNSPVGCFQSQLVTFADPSNFTFGYTLRSGVDNYGGVSVDISEMENEAFSISGSILYNRDRTKKYDLKDGIWDQNGTMYDPVVGVTFYEAELSYRTFADRVELKTDHDLVWNNIYERSLGFGSATIPAGYATGGFSKKADLDTPEKALKAWTFPRLGEDENGFPKWHTAADVDMAGLFYRWTQPRYHYDAKQQACDYSVYDCTGTIEIPNGDCPPGPVAGNVRFYGQPQKQITTKVCQAGNPSAPFPPKFDEGQRVHSDGTIDFDDFSHATKTVKNVYTEDPNNPDVFVPDPYGWEFLNGVRGYWRKNGTYENQEQFVSGAKCLTTETLPDPDYDYYIYRPKIKAMPDASHPDAGIFDWSECGEEYSGYTDKWPCTDCWAVDRHVGRSSLSGRYRKGAHGCLKCMSSRALTGPMSPVAEVCSQKFCNSGYVSPGETHSPRNAGYIWYTGLARGDTNSYIYGLYTLTSCCDVECLEWSDFLCPGDPNCRCYTYGSSILTDAAMGCRLIKILKPTASTISSVNLGSLSIKVSLK